MDASDYEMDAVEEIEDPGIGASGVNLVVESSPFDVESYIAQFSGRGKLQRLVYIADHCPSLRIEALQLALKYVMNETYDTQFYEKIVSSLQSIKQTANTPLRTEWIEQIKFRADSQRDSLDTALKNHKSSSIKETVRRSYDALGAHHLACGDFSTALKYYSLARNYATLDSQLFQIYTSITKIFIYQKNWYSGDSYLSSTEGVATTVEEKSKISALAGLFELYNCHYKNAADRFMKVMFITHDTPGNDINQIMSNNSIAIYGVLTALATYSRQELKDRTMNGSFKQFLELEPSLREATIAFQSKFPTCLSLLEEIKDSLKLDLYIGPHVDRLYQLIQERAFIFYFIPYSSTDLNIMARAFNIAYAELEDKLMELILADRLQARIDSQNHILYANTCDSRLLTFDNCLRRGEEWRRKSQALVLKALCTRYDISVRKPYRKHFDMFPGGIEEPTQSQEDRMDNIADC